MAEIASLTVSVRLRWWVLPLVYASIVPALAIGGARRKRFFNAVGNFVLRHGVLARAD